MGYVDSPNERLQLILAGKIPPNQYEPHDKLLMNSTQQRIFQEMKMDTIKNNFNN